MTSINCSLTPSTTNLVNVEVHDLQTAIYYEAATFLRSFESHALKKQTLEQELRAQLLLNLFLSARATLISLDTTAEWVALLGSICGSTNSASVSAHAERAER